MTRSIEVSNYTEDIVSFSDADIELLINKLDTLLPEDLRAPEGEISVAVFTDEGLRKIHIDFLNDSSDTDVITFDGDHADGYSGEICVSAERALDWCGRFSNTASEELSLYIAHGYLHLDQNKLGIEKNRQEIELCHELIKQLTGYEMTLFAPPGGAFSSATLTAAKELGYKTIMWSKDTIDWRDHDSEIIFSRATKNVAGGDLIDEV